MTAPTLAALIIGALIGCALGIVSMCLVRVGQPTQPLARSEILDAYLRGWQDGADGLSADTTRPADLVR